MLLLLMLLLLLLLPLCREIIQLPPSALRGLKEGVADDMLAGETETLGFRV
jgi:hypothetical protein